MKVSLTKAVFSSISAPFLILGSIKPSRAYPNGAALCTFGDQNPTYNHTGYPPLPVQGADAGGYTVKLNGQDLTPGVLADKAVTGDSNGPAPLGMDHTLTIADNMFKGFLIRLSSLDGVLDLSGSLSVPDGATDIQIMESVPNGAWGSYPAIAKCEENVAGATHTGVQVPNTTWFYAEEKTEVTAGLNFADTLDLTVTKTALLEVTVVVNMSLYYYSPFLIELGDGTVAATNATVTPETTTETTTAAEAEVAPAETEAEPETEPEATGEGDDHGHEEGDDHGHEEGDDHGHEEGEDHTDEETEMSETVSRENPASATSGGNAIFAPIGTIMALCLTAIFV